ncbi:MAG: hypothetical protein WBN42_05550 [Ignavibacteriaceae bacterium]
MKSLKCVFVLLAFVGLSLVGCSNEQQSPVTPIDQSSLEKVIITNFTFSHYPIGLTGEGTIKLVGGNWILKDVGVTELIISSDPLVAGIMTHYLSARMDAVTGEGPVHGNWFLVPQANTEGGVFEGNYTGYRSKMPGSDTLFVLPLQLVGHGRGGTIDGMQIRDNTNITAWGTPPEGWYGSGEGFYKSHGN